MSFKIEVSELPESISEFTPIPGHRARIGMEALAITSTEKQAETMAYSKPLNPKAGSSPTSAASRWMELRSRWPRRPLVKDVVGVDGVNTESVVPAVAYYPSDLDSFGDGNVTYLWPRHK